MGYKKSYERIDWKNEQEAKSSPLGAINMNKMDSAIDVLDSRIVELDEKREEMDSSIQVLELEGSDTVSIEKENVTVLATDLRSNFTHTFDKPFTGKISFKCEPIYAYRVYITTETGTEELFCMGGYSEEVSNVLSFSIEPNGAIIDSITITDYKNVLYKFDVPDHSITPEKIEPNYLAQITEKAESAEQSAITASEKAETAKTDADRAKEYADRAQAVSGVSIATKEIAGLVKGGKTAVSEDGELLFTKTTTDRTLTESHAGGLIINSMDGESQQKQYPGKNLLKNTATTATQKGVTFTVNEDKSITVKGTATGIVYFEVGRMKPIANQSYTFSHAVSWDGDAQCYLEGVDGSSNWVTPKTFTPTTDTEFSCRIYIASGKAVDLTFKPMIRLASVTDATYEPYVGGTASPNPDYPQEIKNVEVSEIKSVWKNLFNYKEVESSWYKPISSTVYRKMFKLKPNTPYTISASVNATDVGAYCFMISGNDLDFGANTQNNGAPIGKPRTVVSDENGHIVVGTYAIGANNITVDVACIQLEEGSTATEYQPYQEKSIQLSALITLRGIGDVKDVLCKSDGVYGVLREFSTITFNGTEEWKRVKANETDRYYCNLILDKGQAKIGVDDVPIGYCSHFEKATRRNSYVYATDNRYCTYEKNFTISYNTATSLAEFKTWLASNNVTIDFKLATPTFEPLPLADQIALHRLKTFKGVTHLYTNSTIIPIIEWEGGTSVVGGYALEALNSAEANRLELEQLKTLTNELATQLVAGSEV
jgi:hypothetical protein